MFGSFLYILHKCYLEHLWRLFPTIGISCNIPHTLANTGYYFFLTFSVLNSKNDYISYQINVIQYKLLVCDFILFIFLLDFVNVWQYICRISKTKWTNWASRLQSFMKNNRMLSLKPLDLKPFKSGMHLLSWMQSGTDLIECTMIIKGN